MAFEKKNSCPECHEVFASRAKLDLHVKRHKELSKQETLENNNPSEKEPGSNNSNEKLPEMELLEENINKKQKTEIKESEASSKKLKIQLVCQRCSKTFALQRTFKRHQKICQEISLDSPQKFPRTRSSPRNSTSKPISSLEYDMKDSSCDNNDDPHFKVVIEDQEDTEEFKEEMKGVKPPHQCEICKKQFTRKKNLIRHMEQNGCSSAHPLTFPCQICGEVFNRKDSMQEHLQNHAGDTTNKKMHTCEHCKKNFRSPANLSIHIRTHTGEKPFKCKLCTKAFPSKGALIKHGRVHSGERPYECKECGDRFSQKGTLDRHVLSHSGNRPHKCDFCHKEFIQIGQLKAHLFHHTGENGFSCEHCDKCFNRKARLEMHIRYVHDKVKPFPCQECGKAFVNREDLNRHSVLHTGVKAFHCPTCEKSFAIQASLKIHLLTHRKEPPCSCKECGRAFIRQDCLLRHMRKRHREVLDEFLSNYEKKESPDLILSNSEKKESPVLKTDATSADPHKKQLLEDSIKELLSLLVDESTLKSFGWPERAIDKLLDAVVNHCGHKPVDPSEYSYMEQLWENCKLLFTVAIDETAEKILLDNHTVDEVVLHVIRLAKT